MTRAARAIGTAVAALLFVGAAAAQEGSELTGTALRDAVSGRTVAYANGATQIFEAGGRTAYDSGSFAAGRWRIEADRYCSVWPPSEIWSCYRVERTPDGRGLRFIAADGSTVEGRYID
jgi:hypothetical protein